MRSETSFALRVRQRDHRRGAADPGHLRADVSRARGPRHRRPRRRAAAGLHDVSIVTLNGLGLVTSPLGVFVVAIGIGVIYQVLFALVIIVVRVQPIIVALSGFLRCPASTA